VNNGKVWQTGQWSHRRGGKRKALGKGTGTNSVTDTTNIRKKRITGSHPLRGMNVEQLARVKDHYTVTAG